MGWTYFPSLGRDTIDLLKREVLFDNDQAKLEWIGHASRGSVVYAVVKRTPKAESQDTTYVPDPDGSYRFIAVFLTSRRGRDGYDFGYKDITETMGPVEKDCPQRLLDLASPFRDTYEGYGRDGYGRQWREACAAKRASDRRDKASAPKPGQTFRTLKPVKFRNGAEHTVFTCIRVQLRGRKASVYQAHGSDALYRFRPSAYGFELCPPSTATGTEE